MARRPLTPEEALAAAELRRLVDAGQLRHDEIAAMVGVSPSAVGHWYRGLIPVPAGRAADLADAVGGDPEKICVAFKKLSLSRLLRPDPTILAVAYEAMVTAFSGRKKVFDMSLHASAFADVYEAAAKNGGRLPKSFTDALGILVAVDTPRGDTDGQARLGRTSSKTRRGS
jgi:hypothetical protein